MAFKISPAESKIVFQDKREVLKRLTTHLLMFCVLLLSEPVKSIGSPGHAFVLNSAVSPNGDWIAENFGTDGCCSGGFVVIHKIYEPSSPSDAVIFSASTAPGLFMIWQNNETLSLVQDSNDEGLNGPSIYRGISILYSKYQNRINDIHTFDIANISKIHLNVNEEEVSAQIYKQETSTGRRCGFSLVANDGAIYDKVGISFEANINRCSRARGCAAISSKFWVGKRADKLQNYALTSATVSNIPSANRGPGGDHNNEISGSFNGASALELMSALGSESLEIQYSLNFFDTILSYHMATQALVGSINLFRTCVGDADFDWLLQKPPPTRAE